MRLRSHSQGTPGPSLSYRCMCNWAVCLRETASLDEHAQRTANFYFCMRLSNIDEYRLVYLILKICFSAHWCLRFFSELVLNIFSSLLFIHLPCSKKMWFKFSFRYRGTVFTIFVFFLQFSDFCQTIINQTWHVPQNIMYSNVSSYNGS